MLRTSRYVHRATIQLQRELLPLLMRCAGESVRRADYHYLMRVHFATFISSCYLSRRLDATIEKLFSPIANSSSKWTQKQVFKRQALAGPICRAMVADTWRAALIKWTMDDGRWTIRRVALRHVAYKSQFHEDNAE